MKQLHVRISNDWHEWLTDQCKRTGMTKSGFVRMLFLHFNEMEAPRSSGSIEVESKKSSKKWYDGMPFVRGK